MPKKSASQIAAEQEYFKKNNIPFEKHDVKLVKPKQVYEPSKSEGVEYGLTDSDKDFGIYISTISKIKPALIFMKDIEIVEKLLNHYEEVLKYIIQPEIQAEPVKMKDYIHKMNCQFGVCYCSRLQFGVYIGLREFVDTIDYWSTPPRLVYTSKEMIDCISFRVNKLQEILNEMKDE